MARTGLRMMPTFPSSPLSFRTAGFPPCACKAGLSKGAFPPVADTCRGLPVCVLLSRLPLSGCRSPPCVGARCALNHRHASGQAALPQGSSPRTGLCCPGPSTLNRPHPPRARAQRDFAAVQLLRPVFAVRLRPGYPQLVPSFHCPFFLNMSFSATPGSPTAECTQFLHRRRWPSPLQYCLGTPELSHTSVSRGGHISELDYGSLALRPADWLTHLTDRTGFSSSHRGFLMPGFRRFGPPHLRRLSLRWQLGNFHRRDLHPLEWQLASLRTEVMPFQNRVMKQLLFY
jgi:hypothetical protein